MTQYLSSTDYPGIIDAQSNHKELQDAIYSGKCILVSGFGLSARACTKNGKQPPSHLRGLLEGMTEWCMLQGLIDQEGKIDFSRLFDRERLIEAGFKIEEYVSNKLLQQQCLKEVLLCDQAEVSDIHRLIARIPFRAYLTTNHDTFIEAAFSEVKGYSLKKFYRHSIQGAIKAYKNKQPFILKLHGDVDYPNSINLRDRTFKGNSTIGYRNSLQKLLSESSVLCIGFEQADPDLEGLEYLLRSPEIGDESNKYWIVVPEKQVLTLKSEHLWKNKSINIIKYKLDGTYSELVTFLEKLAQPSLTQSRSQKRVTHKIITPDDLDKRRALNADTDDLQVVETYPVNIPPKPPRIIQIFFSYAHEDENLRDKLEQQLIILKHQGLKIGWYDSEITAGKEWENEEKNYLNTAHIILLLVSSSFLASPYCYGIQMKRAVERHNRGEACVIPIILRPCIWKGTPFAKLQPLPKGSKAITKWSNQDEAFVNVAEGIQKAVIDLRSKLRSNYTHPQENA